MIRNLKVMGLALMAACAMSAVASSAAAAAPALFTAEGVVAPEKARAHGSQVGADTFIIGALPAITCTTATATGEAVTAGPSSTYGRAFTTYETCHVVIPIIGTRTITITTNNLQYNERDKEYKLERIRPDTGNTHTLLGRRATAVPNQTSRNPRLQH